MSDRMAWQLKTANRAAIVGATFLVALLFTAKARAQESKAPHHDEVFTVVLLPDTQFYSEKYPDTYIAQTMWIRERARADNIKFVVCLGDIVQNAHIEKEWQNAHEAARILDGVVPYSAVPGNHDLVVKDKIITRDSTLYNKYFGVSRFENQPWYGGRMDTTNDNNYCTFRAAGRDFLVLSLEFAPRDETLAWAADACQKHPAH